MLLPRDSVSDEVSKPRVLLVPAGEDASRAFARLLRSQGPSALPQWELVVSRDRAEGMAALAASAVDVVVLDISPNQAPDVALLRQLRLEYPDVVRLALAVPTDEEEAVRLGDLVHRVIAKPMDVPRLRAVVEDALVLRTLVKRPSVRRVVGQLGALPPLPPIVQDLRRVIIDPESGARDVAHVARRDPALVAKLLQLSNSAYFCPARRGDAQVTRLEDAVVLLGFSLVQSLALAMGVFLHYEQRKGLIPFSLPLLQRHSFATAEIASRLLPGSPALAEQAFIGGLLHDAGRLVLATAFPESFRRIWSVARRRQVAALIVEEEEYGATHQEVGAYLFGLWGLPASIVRAVAHHHRPALADGKTFGVTTAVHVADWLAHGLMAAANDTLPRADLDRAHLESLGMADKLEAWKATAAQALKTSASI